MKEDRYIFSCKLDVRDYELDSEGIVNNARYLHYLEHTRHLFCKEAGVSFARLCEMGIITVVRRIEIDYINSLHSGDVMLSSLWLERKGPRFIFHQTITNDDTGAGIVRAEVTVVSIEDGRLSRGDTMAAYFENVL